MQNTRKKPVNRGLIVFLSGLAVLVAYILVMLVVNALAVRDMTASLERISGVWAEQHTQAEEPDLDALFEELSPLWSKEENCRSDLAALFGEPLEDDSYLKIPVLITDTEPEEVFTYHSLSSDAGTVHYTTEYRGVGNGVQQDVTLELDANFVREDGKWKIVSMTVDYWTTYM